VKTHDFSNKRPVIGNGATVGGADNPAALAAAAAAGRDHALKKKNESKKKKKKKKKKEEKKRKKTLRNRLCWSTRSWQESAPGWPSRHAICELTN
jgi:hypothetical protein